MIPKIKQGKALESEEEDGFEIAETIYYLEKMAESEFLRSTALFFSTPILLLLLVIVIYIIIKVILYAVNPPLPYVK